MKTRMIARASMGFALLGLLATSPAAAQKGSFEIGVGAGLVEMDAKLGSDTGASLDLRAGYFVTDRFQIEAQSYQSTAILAGAFSTYTLNALYHFEVSGDFVPYLLVGAGTADVEADEPLDGWTDDGTALRVAAGGRFWLSERQRTSARVEISALSEDSFGHDSTHVGVIVTFGRRFGR